MHKKKIFLIILSLIILYSCSDNNSPAEDNTIKTPPINSIHTILGVPVDNDASDDYWIIRPQYVVSYNKNKNVPNWVAWELNSEWFGEVSRYSGRFITDTSLPSGFYRVTHDDYTNSGYDRGHMVMSEERTATVEDNKSTFILTNVIPQEPDLNQGVWLKLESFCNNLALNFDKEIFIYSGGIFHTNETIGNGVTVPDSCFKIIVVMEKGETAKNVNENTQVIAVVMPNISGVRNDDWTQYITTVRRIEYSTGYDFFNIFPKKLQEKIENKIYAG
jgi:endonuclease G, mitochondrial